MQAAPVFNEEGLMVRTISFLSLFKGKIDFFVISGKICKQIV